MCISKTFLLRKNFTLQAIGEEFVEFLEKELNVTGEGNDDTEGNPYSKSQEEKRKDNAEGEGKKESSIEDNIDDIEAALAQLKKELGL